MPKLLGEVKTEDLFLDRNWETLEALKELEGKRVEIADLKLENSGKVPAWRKICKTLLRNDYWCKGLGFSPTKTSAYKKYLEFHKKKRALQGGDSFLDKM